jgi:UDP-glucuronate decarboxylase
MAYPGKLTTAMNLGNPEEFTILELAQLVLQLTGSRSKMVFSELPSDDPLQRCPNIDLAQRELGWKPRVKLRQGLERTIAYFDRVLSHESRGRKRTRTVQPVSPIARPSLPGNGLDDSSRSVADVQY